MTSSFRFDDLWALYERYKARYGAHAYRHISELFDEAHELHRRGFSGRDHGQSWKSFKGHNMEKLLVLLITDQVESLGLKIIPGSKLERANPENLPDELAQVKAGLLIEYGALGSHLPDADIVVYDPASSKTLAVISSKVTLRERITQSGYWKFKVRGQPRTRDVRFYFVTLDEDGDLIGDRAAKKSRAIVETELDGTYVLTPSEVNTSDKVKPFSQFIDDLRAHLTQAGP